jgi:hypothetical protein
MERRQEKCISEPVSQIEITQKWILIACFVASHGMRKPVEAAKSWRIK